MLEKQTAKEIALACGFKLKLQDNGEMDLNPYVYDAFNKVAEYCLNKQWISVDNELPNTSGEHFLVYGFCKIMKCHEQRVLFSANKKFYEDKRTFEITHWQPLPQPPKE